MACIDIDSFKRTRSLFWFMNEIYDTPSLYLSLPQSISLTRPKSRPCICAIFYFIGIALKMGNLWQSSYFFSPILIYTRIYTLLWMVSFHTCKNTYIRVLSRGMHSFCHYLQKRVSLFLVGYVEKNNLYLSL